MNQLKTKSGNHQLGIKLRIGEFEFWIVFLRIWDWGFRIEDWGKINIGKTPIGISTFSSLISNNGDCRTAPATPGLLTIV